MEILKTLVVDVEKKLCVLNGENISADTSELHLDFENGEWSLAITRNLRYAPATQSKE